MEKWIITFIFVFASLFLRWHRSPDGWLMRPDIHYVEQSHRSHLADIHRVLMTRGTCRCKLRPGALWCARHVPCECKTRVSRLIVKNVRYANAAGELKKTRRFRLLFWMAVSICVSACRLFLLSEALPLPIFAIRWNV